MNNNKTARRINRKKNIIDQGVYEKELRLCQKLFLKNNGKCGWGVCHDCGVIPLLHKLYQGETLEDPELIKKIKNFS